MKRTLAFRFFVLMSLIPILAACSTWQDIPKSFNTYGYDFRPYTAKGFLFTPEEYKGDYEPIGWFLFTIKDGVTRQKQGISARFLPDLATAEESIEYVYNEVSAMGADALVRFDISIIKDTVGGTNMLGKGYQVTGFAIKRK